MKLFPAAAGLTLALLAGAAAPLLAQPDTSRPAPQTIADRGHPLYIIDANISEIGYEPCGSKKCNVASRKVNIQKMRCKMMYMFCGDSHSRIFKLDSWGKYSFNSFSGATVAGLESINSTTGHGRIVSHLVD